MTHNMRAIIPRDDRISAITSDSLPDGGIGMRPATAQEYYDFAAADDFDLGHALASREQMRLVITRGVAVSQEIFDTIRIGVPFAVTSLVGELSTIEHLADKTQYGIINATLLWLTIQDEPQCRRQGAQYVL